MDEMDFVAKYHHDITKRVTVVNPTTEDFVFQHVLEVGIDVATGKMKNEQRTYRVPAGGRERFPGPVADHYLDQMSKMQAQDDDKLQFMIDPALRAQYWEKLIAEVEDLVSSYQEFNQPDYLEKPAPKPEETFAEAQHIFVGQGADQKAAETKKK